MIPSHVAFIWNGKGNSVRAVEGVRRVTDRRNDGMASSRSGAVLECPQRAVKDRSKWRHTRHD